MNNTIKRIKFKQMFRGITSLFLLAIGFSSCGVNTSILFKSPTGEYANIDSLPIRPEQEYIISPDDKLVFSISTNDGAKLIESLSNVSEKGGSTGFSPEFLVLQDSTANLPIIGKLKVAGLNVQQCESLLAEKYAAEYQEPFVQVKIVNQRVIVFPGGAGEAIVISLENNNTTLMEVIAKAGGVSERGRAKSVKLMRRVNGERKVFTIDISTIEGLRYADVIVQANDYVYIEPNPQLVRETLNEIAPIVALLTNALILATFIITFQ